MEQRGIVGACVAMMITGCAVAYDTEELSSGQSPGVTGPDSAISDAAQWPDGGADDASGGPDAACQRVVKSKTLFPSQCENVAFGTHPWTDATSAMVAGGASATVYPVYVGKTTQLLFCRFVAGLQNSDAVVGVQLDVYRAGGGVKDAAVFLRAGNANTAGKQSSAKWPDAVALKSYGGPKDSWGSPLTPEILNSGDFGAMISAANVLTSGVSKLETVGIAFVDGMRMTVWYSPQCQNP